MPLGLTLFVFLIREPSFAFKSSLLLVGKPCNISSQLDPVKVKRVQLIQSRRNNRPKSRLCGTNEDMRSSCLLHAGQTPFPVLPAPTPPALSDVSVSLTSPRTPPDSQLLYRNTPRSPLASISDSRRRKDARLSSLVPTWSKAQLFACVLSLFPDFSFHEATTPQSALSKASSLDLRLLLSLPRSWGSASSESAYF